MGFLKDFRKNIMAPMGRPMSIMGIQPRFQSSILPRQPQSREEYKQMAQEGTLFGGQPLQAPIAMPRNPEMVEQINQQMFPQPIPQVRSPLQNAFDNIKRQIQPTPQPLPPQQLLQPGGNPPPPPSYIDEQKKFELEMAQEQSLLNQQQSPLAPPMAPPISKRGEFESITQDPNERLREDSNDSERFRRGITPLVPIESGGQPIPAIDPFVPRDLMPTTPPMAPPAKGGIRGIPGVGTDPSNTDLSTLPRLIPSNPSTQRSILDDFVPPPGYKEQPPVGGPALPRGGPVPYSNLLPPKRNDFMSIAQDPNQRLNEDGNISTPLVGGVQGNGLQGTQVSNPNNLVNSSTNNQFENVGTRPQTAIEASAPGNTDIDKQRALLAGSIDMNGGLGANNFGGVNLGGTPIRGGIQQRNDEFVDYEYTNSDDLRERMKIDRLAPPLPPAPGIGGMGGGNEGTMRTGDFQDTDMNGRDDRNQPDFSGPSQEYLDQQARIKDMFGGGTLGDLPPGFNMDRQPSVGGGGDIGRPPVGLAQPAPGIGGMGGRPGEPEPINFGQPPVGPVNPGTAPVSPPPTNGMPPVPPGLTAVTPPVEPVNVTTPTDPNMSVNMPVAPLDPVLLQQSASEVQSDPLLRSLYFGTQDSPGFYNQLQQAGANLIGSDVPLQQTAGLTPLELLARQKAVAGLGGFEPFLQQNRDLVNQGIAQSKRAEELQDPYYTQAEDIYKDTMGAYDPSMTQQFYNPYEDRVVQQTIDDVMKAGDKQDIASRAREISSGAFGGSRARLGAEERRESLGKGLAQALGNIRSQGFQNAQSTGLGEFARQQQAKRTGAQGLMGIGVGRGSAASQLGQQLAGYGSQIGGLGSTQEGLRAGQRGELSGYGSTGRGIAETGLGRIFEQQTGQQYRPMQVLGQIGSMLPGYQASSSRIDSQYGLPTDPKAAGLGAAFSAYGAVAPRQGQG